MVTSDNLFENRRLPCQKVLSNLPLQMALYFNIVILPIWCTIIILFFNKQYYIYEELYKYIIITLLTTVFIVEFIRLYLGYEGNLKDKIPELAGFWILSLLIQFPLQGFLLFNPYIGMHVLEIVIQSIMFVMLMFQLFTGYYAVKQTAREQSREVKNKLQ